MFRRLKALFTRKAPPAADEPKPTREEAVVQMYDKQLSCYTDEVIRVVYSADREKRIVLLKSDKGFFYYVIEALAGYTDDDWAFLFDDPHVLPAMWAEYYPNASRSLFGSVSEAWEELVTTPQYKRFFDDKERPEHP